MHPVSNDFFSAPDLNALMLYGITIPLSFLTGIALAKATRSGTRMSSKPAPAATENLKRKREKATDESDTVSTTTCDTPDPPAMKKARLMVEPGSEEESEEDFSLYESTFVNQEADTSSAAVTDVEKSKNPEKHCKIFERRVYFVPASGSSGKTFAEENDISLSFCTSANSPNGTEKACDSSTADKIFVDPRFDFGAKIEDKKDQEKDTEFDSVASKSFLPPGTATSVSASPSPGASPSTRDFIDAHASDYVLIASARREWELSWFVCAHHAAFTAATAMSLRREIRRRKTLSRMWRSLKKENDELRMELVNERNERCVRGLEGKGTAEYREL